jgi:GT2 family glycosyltransferase/cyclopropane fatty-acyl-phospholipid synthase-like methyltransferase
LNKNKNYFKNRLEKNMSGTINLDININYDINNFVYESGEQNDCRLTSIIILTYNQLEYTKVCIESIRKFTDKNKYEIIVVDNKSTDRTVEWLKEQDDLVVIYNEENKGFPAGCNQGIAIAKGDSILLLNNDVIVTPNWLYNLDKALWSSSDIGAVGAVSNSCSYYQQIDVSYNDINEMLNFANAYNKSDEDYWSYRTKLIGFCMLIKKEVLDEVGLLDEIFTPGNYEDDDISFRIISDGYKLLLCKDTFIHHFGSVSFGKVSSEYNKILQTNINKFKDKWNFNPSYSNMIRFDLVNMIENDRKDNLNILEIGCGTGATLLEIKSRYKNCNIFGIEICKGPAKIASNVCDTIVGNIEELELTYENKFFDYIILGDVLEHLNNPWEVLSSLKKYLKKDGYIIASIPNIMHVSVMRNLAQGNFSYTDAGILDRTHLRFFTLKEIQKLFNDNHYDICNVSSVQLLTSQEDEDFINNMCNLYGQELRNQYKAYQYIVKASNGIDYDRYISEEMIKLKYSLMRIDNNLDIDNSINCIFKLYSKYSDDFIDDIEYLIESAIINKDDVLNRIGVEAFKKGLYDFSISILMLSLKINRNNTDTVYNISYLLTQMDEYELALSILNNSSDEVKADLDIANMIKMIEGDGYEQ